MRRGTASRPRWAWLTAGCLATLIGFSALTSTTESSWTAGKVTNSANSTSGGALAFTHVGSATCAAGPAVTTTTTCSGSEVPSTSPPATGSATRADTITDNGTINAARLAQTVQAPSCGPVKFDNTKTAADPLLARYNMTFQQADPWSRTGNLSTSAVGLSNNAYASDISSSSALGADFSVGVWFKVASGYNSGGGLLSLETSLANGTSTSGSPAALWMDGSGKIRYSVNGLLGPTTGVSAATYNNGGWHLAVLSVNYTFLVGTVTLYVDGNASQAGIGLPPGASTSFWHAGWVDPTGLANAPPSATLTGSLSGAFVAASVVSQASATALSNVNGTASSYITAVQSLMGLHDLWMLGDPGTTTYAGTLPSTMATPCARVNVGFAFTNPADSIATQTLAAFANGVTRTVAVPGPSVTQKMTVSVTRATVTPAYSTDIAGLHLYAPLTIIEKTTAGAWALNFTWTGADGAFIA